MARGRLKVADNALPDRIVVPDLDAVIVAGALHQADLIGFRLVIADPPADLRTLQASARWVVAAQEPEAGAVRFRGDTVVVTLRRDGGDGAGDREPRQPLPPRLSDRPPLGDEPPTPLERALPPLGRTRDELGQDATVLRFERPSAGH
ncbi:MAG TPA: hypothetical protein PKY70_10795 [Nakamurella multipartita]|nr:hypothetical protein [Nakamurella multipartita]